MKNIIAIDVGNTETTVGVGNSSEWKSYRYTTRKAITSDELFMMFKENLLFYLRGSPGKGVSNQIK